MCKKTKTVDDLVTLAQKLGVVNSAHCRCNDEISDEFTGQAREEDAWVLRDKLGFLMDRGYTIERLEVLIRGDEA